MKFNTTEIHNLFCKNNREAVITSYWRRTNVSVEDAKIEIDNFYNEVTTLTEEEENLINENSLVKAVKALRNRTGVTLEAAIHVAKSSETYKEHIIKNIPLLSTYVINEDTLDSFRVTTKKGESFLIKVSEDNLEIRIMSDKKLSLDMHSPNCIIVKKN